MHNTEEALFIYVHKKDKSVHTINHRLYDDRCAKLSEKSQGTSSSRSEKKGRKMNYFEWVTEGLLIFIVGIIGLFGNGVSIWTFWRQRVHRIFHNLLLILAIFDMVSD